MSTELEQARSLAERIARKVSAGSLSSHSYSQPNNQLATEIAAVRASISELQKKLAQLESRVREDGPTITGRSASAQRSGAFVPPTHSPWLAGVNAVAAQPTEERFGVEEAVISELVDYFQSEQKCAIDPSDKPCDHCAMCSARGF